MGKRPLIDAVSPLIILKKKKKKITSKMSPCPSLTVLSSSSKLPKRLLVRANQNNKKQIKITKRHALEEKTEEHTKV
jgi:hypothetical protein